MSEHSRGRVNASIRIAHHEDGVGTTGVTMRGGGRLLVVIAV